MAIKDKATYGEYYWAMQVEAEIMFDEQCEDAMSPLFASVLGDIPEISDLPTGTQSFLHALVKPHAGGLGDLLKLTGGEFLAEILKDALEPAMKVLKRSTNKRAKETWITSTQANLLHARNKITDKLLEEIIASEGYEDVHGAFLYKSELPYPTIPDLILYSRYHGDPKNIWSTLKDYYQIDPTDRKLWEWLGLQRLTTDQVHTAWRRGVLGETDLIDKFAEIGWDTTDSALLKETGWTIPNAMLLVQGNLQQEASEGTILDDISKADINPLYAQQYLDAVLTKPASQDLLAYGLRQDSNLPDIENQLKKIGIHPDYHHIYKELAYQIPPVADIITMAVREAFTPSIAAKFGQYEDLPDEFVSWAGKKGLTKDWASRYWAAHWSLPSPQQGYEMLHRGIINKSELLMLMRALDIMPFWRDKLMDMSYRRLTRVDVRRMYKQGVLDEAGVLDAYIQHGYAPMNAQRMTEFTIKQSLSTMAKFTTADVVSAFTKQMISRDDAGDLLNMLGVRGADREYILSTAEYKRIWALTEQKIKAVRNLYRRGIYDENQARDKLSRLDLPATRISVLMEQWLYEAEAAEKQTWTASQTLSFMKKNLISADRGKRELQILGYDEEHIDVYMKSIQ